MNLTEYYRRHPRLLNEPSAYLEKEFIENVFYPEFGNNGLSYLEYQKGITDSIHRRHYYIDFVIQLEDKKYAIELDGYNYHAKLSPKEFEKQEERTNEITRRGYELIRFSFYKIKNNPSAVRRELRQRIPMPKDSSDDKPNHNSTLETIEWKKRPIKKLSIIPGIIILSVSILLTFQCAHFISLQKVRTSQRKQDNFAQSERNNVNAFVEYYNNNSKHKITNLAEINLKNESSKYYRKTNTYAGDNSIAMYGEIGNSQIWVISCSPTEPTSMRLYVETKDYDLLTELVHIGVPYFNPKSKNNEERLSNKFDAMVNSSRTGLFIDAINGTYVVLKQIHVDGSAAILDRDKVSDWRLNMNTNCNNIIY